MLEDLDRQGILVDEVVAELDRNADHVIEGLAFPSSAAATVTWRTCPTHREVSQSRRYGGALSVCRFSDDRAALLLHAYSPARTADLVVFAALPQHPWPRALQEALVDGQEVIVALSETPNRVRFSRDGMHWTETDWPYRYAHGT